MDTIKKYLFRSEEIKKNIKTSELSEGLFKIKILCSITVDEKDTASEIWKWNSIS